MNLPICFMIILYSVLAVVCTSKFCRTGDLLFLLMIIANCLTGAFWVIVALPEREDATEEGEANA